MKRFWEIDFLRGLSVILMIGFNWSYALNFLDILLIAPQSSQIYWEIFPEIIGSSFILISGISLFLSRRKAEEKNLTIKQTYLKYLKRSSYIFSLGLGITAVTYVFYPENFIFFGILHLIGFSTLISFPIADKPKLSLLTGLGIILTSFILSGSTESFLLAAIGFHSVEIQTFDLFPIFPYSGLMLIGVYLGDLFYSDGDRRFDIKDREVFRPLRLIGRYLGQNSLLIYLIHQPLLILILLLLGFNVI